MSNLRSRASSVARNAYYFFPSRLHDRDAYTATVRKRFGAMGYAVQSAHETAAPQKAVEETDAIFIGGGNTFRLLKALQDLDLIEAIRRKVEQRSALHR